MSIPVVWINYNDTTTHRGAWWDQTIVETMLADSRHNLTHHVGSWQSVPPTDGVVVVTPGHYDAEGIARLNGHLERRRWAIIIVTSDEEDTFDWSQISVPHGRRIVWKQHPTTSTPDRILPLGPPAHALDIDPADSRGLAWVFAGQITHERRQQMARALTGLAGGTFVPTDRFLDTEHGVTTDRHMALLQRSRYAPAPSGPNTPDSFRLYEALEAGAIPIVDDGPIRHPDEFVRTLMSSTYFDRAFWTPPPFPKVSDWHDAVDIIQDTDPLAEETLRLACESWWQLEKRNLARRLDADITTLSGVEVGGMTAIVTTSPVPANPSASHLTETVASILNRSDCDVIVAADGVRPEQDDQTDDYLRYLRTVVGLSRTDWSGRVWVDFTGEWLHQAGTTARALRSVWTPHVLFAEHDTPLVGEIPFDGIAEALDVFDVVRLHHEASILPDHRHLNHGPPVTIGGVAFQPTVQWSQRPHVARRDAYDRIMDMFPPSARTMIEDRLHGEAQTHPWTWLRTAIYAPDGDIKRSTHSDARGDQPKYEMRMT